MSEIAPVAQINEVDGQPQAGEQVQLDEMINADRKLRLFKDLAMWIAAGARSQNGLPDSEAKYWAQVDNLNTVLNDWADVHSIDPASAAAVHDHIMGIATSNPLAAEAAPESGSKADGESLGTPAARTYTLDELVPLAPPADFSRVTDPTTGSFRINREPEASSPEEEARRNANSRARYEQRMQAIAEKRQAKQLAENHGTLSVLQQVVVQGQESAAAADERAYDAFQTGQAAQETRDHYNKRMNAEIERAVLSDPRANALYTRAQAIADERANLANSPKPGAAEVIAVKEDWLSESLAAYRESQNGTPEEAATADRIVDFIMEMTDPASKGIDFAAKREDANTVAPAEANPDPVGAAAVEAEPRLTGLDAVDAAVAEVRDRLAAEEAAAAANPVPEFNLRPETLARLNTARERYAALTARDRQAAFGRYARTNTQTSNRLIGIPVIGRAIAAFNQRQGGEIATASEEYQLAIEEAMNQRRLYERNVLSHDGEELRMASAYARIEEDEQLERLVVENQANTPGNRFALKFTDWWERQQGFKGNHLKGAVVGASGAVIGVAAGAAVGLIAGAGVGAAVGAAAGAVTGGGIGRMVNRLRGGAPADDHANTVAALRSADTRMQKANELLQPERSLDQQAGLTVDMTEADTDEVVVNNRWRMLGSAAVASVAGLITGGLVAREVNQSFGLGNRSIGETTPSTVSQKPAPADVAVNEGSNPGNNLESGQTTLDQAGNPNNLESSQQTLEQAGQAVAERIQVAADIVVNKSDGITQVLRKQAAELGLQPTKEQLFDVYAQLEQVLGEQGIVTGTDLYRMPNGDLGFIEPDTTVQWSDEAREIINRAFDTFRR